jgi:DMSO/TMAO reductase YedYZ molybdopterin-dependent catalytic subunit
MSRQFFAQLDENNVVTTVHCVTQQFLEANPDRYQGVGLKHFLTQTAKPTQALVSHTITTHKTLRPPPIEPIDEP